MTKPTLKADLDTELLPPFARELADLIGLNPLLKLVEVRGGLPLYVPEKITKHHALANLIGIKAAKKLTEAYGGDSITIPNCATSIQELLHREIAERRNNGESEASVAADIGMWGRSIRRIHAKYKKPDDDRQGKLL